MNLCPHFTIEEFVVSQTAIRKNIDNTPGKKEIKAMKLLCKKVLEPLRASIDKPVNISSGFRCEKLNTAIGGAKQSQHINGEATDISAKGFTTEQLYLFIKKSTLPFGQLIQEFDSWVHVSYRKNPRGQCLRAVKVIGKTKYNPD